MPSILAQTTATSAIEPLVIHAFAPRVGAIDSMTVESWRARGLVYVAVADLPRGDLETLRQRF